MNRRYDREGAMFKYVKFKELLVANQDRALRFYTELLGRRVAVDRPYRDGARWIELEIPGAQTRILVAPRPDDTPTDAPSLYLIVEDIEAGYHSLQARGVAFARAPAAADWNPELRYALFRDSEGNTILLGTA